MGDYDRKPLETAGIFLRLKSKGEQVRLRIASAPYREIKVWSATNDKQPPLKAEVLQSLSEGQWVSLLRDPEYTVSEVFHFIVIDRADGNAKIFTTTGGVYGKVRDLAQNDEWGDPKTYDLTITRTEKPGKNYYEVLGSPNKSVLSKQELAKVDLIDMSDKLPAALPAASAQPDDIDPNTEPEELPESLASPKE